MHCLIDLRLITGLHSSALLICFRAQEESLSPAASLLLATSRN
ncbi:unnamed protein product, partial [Musa banksii]